MSSCRRPSPPHFPPLRPVAASSSGFVYGRSFTSLTLALLMEWKEERKRKTMALVILCCYKQWEPYLVDTNTSTMNVRLR